MTNESPSSNDQASRCGPRKGDGTQPPVLDYGTGRTQRVVPWFAAHREWLTQAAIVGAIVLLLGLPLLMAFAGPGPYVVVAGAAALFLALPLVACICRLLLDGDKKAAPRVWLCVFAILYAAALGVQGVLFATPRPPDGRARCLSNMRMVGSYLVMHAQDHQRRFPDQLDDTLALDKSRQIKAHCPIASLRANDSAPYIYVGKGKTLRSPATEVLLYEPLGNHQGKGICVLYCDGSVSWLNRAEAEALIRRLEAEASKGP